VCVVGGGWGGGGGGEAGLNLGPQTSWTAEFIVALLSF